MKIQLKKRSFADVQTGIFFAILGFAGLLLSLFVPQILNTIPACFFRQWSGIPCPSCGATRAGILASHLHLWEAFTTNPLFFFIYIILFLWSANSIAGWWLKKNIRITLSKKERKIITISAWISIPLNWIYLVLANTIH